VSPSPSPTLRPCPDPQSLTHRPPATAESPIYDPSPIFFPILRSPIPHCTHRRQSLSLTHPAQTLNPSPTLPRPSIPHPPATSHRRVSDLRSLAHLFPHSPISDPATHEAIPFSFSAAVTRKTLSLSSLNLSISHYCTPQSRALRPINYQNCPPAFAGRLPRIDGQSRDFGHWRMEWGWSASRRPSHVVRALVAQVSGERSSR
jgi:hypothetical protein